MTETLEDSWRLVVISCWKLHKLGERHDEFRMRDRLLTINTLRGVQSFALAEIERRSREHSEGSSMPCDESQPTADFFDNYDPNQAHWDSDSDDSDLDEWENDDLDDCERGVFNSSTEHVEPVEEAIPTRISLPPRSLSILKEQLEPEDSDSDASETSDEAIDVKSPPPFGESPSKVFDKPRPMLARRNASLNVLASVLSPSKPAAPIAETNSEPSTPDSSIVSDASDASDTETDETYSAAEAVRACSAAPCGGWPCGPMHLAV